MDHAHAHDTGDHHDDHGGLGKYVVVFICLCGLTLCSFMTTSEFWPFAKTPTWIFMMGVSCAKAMLVILFFMHLLWEANWKYVLTIPAAMMSTFLLLMLVPDVGCRRMWYAEERIVHAASAEHAEEHIEAHEGDHDADEHESPHEAAAGH
jgi:cytochrome c oxidase subunit 4